VRVALTGFTSSLRSNVEAGVGQVNRQDFSLSVGDVNQRRGAGAGVDLDTETTTSAR